MVETAAHLTYHVFPRLPVRQWVLSVPKRLRYFMQRDGALLNMVLRIFLRVIAQSLQAHCPGAANADKTTLHIGAVAFIHRFGSSLNEHVHFHVGVMDGVFEDVAGDVVAGGESAAPPSVIFHPVCGFEEDAIIQAQATLRRRILRAFVARSLLEKCDAKDMQAYQHSGFSIDAGVCIEAHDRAALERLRKAGSVLVYRCAKQRSEPTSDKRGAKADELTLIPLELIDRIAARPAHYLWAVLIARIYEVFPLVCPICSGQMRIIAFITHRADIRQILDHIGVESEPPHISPARGPPLWEDGGDAQMDDGVQTEPDPEMSLVLATQTGAGGPRSTIHCQIVPTLMLKAND
jgi:hypothetical protein